MKIKFVIMSWSGGGWYNAETVESYPNVESASQYDTYQLAEDTIKTLPKGIFQIEKLFINE